MSVCDVCELLNVYDIQLGVADCLRKDHPRAIRDRRLDCLFVTHIDKYRFDTERLKIVKHIDRTTIETRARYDLLSGIHDIEQCIRDRRHSRSTGDRCNAAL